MGPILSHCGENVNVGERHVDEHFTAKVKRAHSSYADLSAVDDGARADDTTLPLACWTIPPPAAGAVSLLLVLFHGFGGSGEAARNAPKSR